jgi:hypothetical protein
MTPQSDYARKITSCKRRLQALRRGLFLVEWLVSPKELKPGFHNGSG